MPRGKKNPPTTPIVEKNIWQLTTCVNCGRQIIRYAEVRNDGSEPVGIGLWTHQDDSLAQCRPVWFAEPAPRAVIAELPAEKLSREVTDD